MFNFHQYRLIEARGWTLGWTWADKEAIWNMMGAQTTEQGDCSKLKGLLPHCCKRDPEVVDLLPGTPYSQQTANCCKGGVISSWRQDPQAAISSFQVTVGSAGTTKTTVTLPKKFTLKAPGPGYTCGSAKVVKPTRFPTNDGRRATQLRGTPTCCVSLSVFYSETIVPCPTCTCGCQKNGTRSGNCVDQDESHLPSGLGKDSGSPSVQCTSHMCPIRIHWHVKLNYKVYWRELYAVELSCPTSQLRQPCSAIQL
ncbi:hypothetical protein P3S67_026347 [Capsicum chacoense]